MKKTYRVGAIGFAHMHINHLLDEFAALPNIQWVACADTVPTVPVLTDKKSTRTWNLRRAHEETGIPKVYDDYRELLDAEDLDIVIYCPENARCGEVGEAIAKHGIHGLTEKPMTASLSGALRIARAVQANDVELMVNWPTTWSPAVRKMKELIDEGVVGEVWEIKWRNGASMGPLAYTTGENLVSPEEKGAAWWHQSEPGGGALLDYCCYGACLSRWFLEEQATAAYGLKANLQSHYGDAEDNAVMTVRFPHAMAILEATWTTWNVGVPTGPIAYGSRGTLVVSSREDEEGHRVPVVEIYTSRGHGLTAPDEVIEGDPLPDGRETLAKEFIHHLETGDPLHPTLQLQHNIEVMAILDAGIRSAESGQFELVDNANWCIG